MTDVNAQRQFFVTLFKVFEERNLNYVVLHSWQTLPEVATSDVDMVIAAKEKPRLENVLAEVAQKCGWRFVQKLWYDVPWCFYYVAVSPDGNNSAALDFVSDPDGVGEYRIADDKILSQRESNGLLYHLPAEAELAYKLAKRRVKGVFRDADVSFVHDYFARSDKEVLRKRMLELLPEDVCEQLMALMLAGKGVEDYRVYMASHSPAFRLFGRRWRIRWRPIWFVSQVRRILDRVNRPTGCVLYGTKVVTFPPFVFRRERRVKDLSAIQRKKALSSATLVFVECDESRYDIGTGIKPVDPATMREAVYAGKDLF